MRHLFITIFLFSMTLVVAQATYGQDRWQSADAAIDRLSPTTFSRLPRPIIRNLEARGCTVPQSFGNRQPHNVTSGEFARIGQRDWAVLCSRNRVSSILVFWGGSTQGVSEIAKSADRTFLQTIDGQGSIGFSRTIEVVGKEQILDYYREFAGRKPPRTSHQGINDGFVGKASVVRYYHRGRWLERQGAD